MKHLDDVDAVIRVASYTEGVTAPPVDERTHVPVMLLDPILDLATKPERWIQALTGDKQTWRLVSYPPSSWPTTGHGTPPTQWYQVRASIDSNGNWDPMLSFSNPTGEPWEIRADGGTFRDCEVPRPAPLPSREWIPLRHHTINDPTGYPTTGHMVAHSDTGGLEWSFDPYQFWYMFGGRWIDLCMFGDEELPGPGSRWAFRASWEDTDLPRFATKRDEIAWKVNVEGYFGEIGMQPECSPRRIQTDMAGYPPHVGPHALMYSGSAFIRTGRECHCYFNLYRWADIPTVLPQTKLFYWIYPTHEMGRYVGVDLICTDGTTLRDSGAVDQNGRSMHPNAGRGVVGRWSWVKCEIGRWLAGKQLDRILVAFDRPDLTGPHQFRGYIDDISIRL